MILGSMMLHVFLRVDECIHVVTWINHKAVPRIPGAHPAFGSSAAPANLEEEPL